MPTIRRIHEIESGFYRDTEGVPNPRLAYCLELDAESPENAEVEADELMEAYRAMKAAKETSRKSQVKEISP